MKRKHLLSLTIGAMLAMPALMSTAAETDGQEETVLGTWTPTKAAASQETNFPGTFEKYGYFCKKGFGAKEQEVPYSLFPYTIKAGDIIRVYYYPQMDAITNTALPQIQPVVKKDDSNWTWTQIIDHADMAYPTDWVEGTDYPLMTFDYVIGSSQTTYKEYRDAQEADEEPYLTDVAEEIAALRAHGFWIKGQLFFLNKVEVVQVGAPADPDEGWYKYDLWKTDAPEAFGNWAHECDIPVAASQYWANLQVGDKIRFHGVEASNGAQVQVNVKLKPSWTWTEIAKGNASMMGETEAQYDMEITEEIYAQLQNMQDKLFYLKGQLMSVDNIQLLTKTEIVPEVWYTYNLATVDPSVDLGSWTNTTLANDGVQLDNTYASHLAVGDVLRINLVEVGSGAQVQLVQKIGSAWTWTPFAEGDAETDGTDNYFDYTFKAEDADLIANIVDRGIWIKGKLCSVSGVQMRTKTEIVVDEPEDPTTWYTYDLATVDPAVDLGSWANTTLAIDGVQLDNTYASHLAVGDILRINVVEAKEDAQVQIVEKVGADWSWTAISEGDVVESSYFDYKFKEGDETTIANIVDRGIWIKGKLCSVSGVQMRTPTEIIIDTPEEPTEFTADFDFTTAEKAAALIPGFTSWTESTQTTGAKYFLVDDVDIVSNGVTLKVASAEGANENQTARVWIGASGAGTLRTYAAGSNSSTVSFTAPAGSYFTEIDIPGIPEGLLSLKSPEATLVTDGMAKAVAFTTNKFTATMEDEVSNVVFNAGKVQIKTISVKYAKPSAIEGVGAEIDNEAEAIYFNLQGVRVANPTKGIFIRVAGSKSSKVYIK